MADVAGWIADIVDAMSSGKDVDAVIERVRGEAEKLCARYPVYNAQKRAA
jgi:glycine hydroxymethyltransferase